MAVIRFRPEHSWIVARWACRQILEDVLAITPQDSEVIKALREQADVDGILLDSFDPLLAAKISNRIKFAAEEILSGRIQSSILEKPFGNPHMVEEYRKGLKQLLDIIPNSDDVDQPSAPRGV